MSIFERFRPRLLCFPHDVARACTSSEVSSVLFPCTAGLASSALIKRSCDAPPYNDGILSGKVSRLCVRCRHVSLQCKRGSAGKESRGSISITARAKTKAAGRAYSHDRFRITEFASNGQRSGKSSPSLGTSTITSAAPDNNYSEVQVVEAVQSLYRPMLIFSAKTEQEEWQVIDRVINATILGAAGLYALTKLFTVDQDYWHGWTIFEILKYAPLHNWTAYEEALRNHPVLAKMMISGIVYSVGDVLAQCYEGKPMLEFSRVRMLRSGLVGFCLHGSLSHFYYQFCEAIFPFKDWWVVPLKVAFDQTVWSAFWNSVYYITVGLLRFESPLTILSELRATFLPLLMAGWKLWPFAHLVTYGFIPVEQRLLWVDSVELVWVTILSMYSNEKAEARNLDVVSDDAAQLVLNNNIDSTNEAQ